MRADGVPFSLDIEPPYEGLEAFETLAGCDPSDVIARLMLPRTQ